MGQYFYLAKENGMACLEGVTVYVGHGGHNTLRTTIPFLDPEYASKVSRITETGKT